MDCDFCHEPLPTATTCCDFEQLVWSCCAQDLQLRAREQGWTFNSERHTFLCVTCQKQLEEVRNHPDTASKAADPESITLHMRDAGWAHICVERYLEYLEWRGMDVDSRLAELEERLRKMFEF